MSSCKRPVSLLLNPRSFAGTGWDRYSVVPGQIRVGGVATLISKYVQVRCVKEISDVECWLLAWKLQFSEEVRRDLLDEKRNISKNLQTISAALDSASIYSPRCPPVLSGCISLISQAFHHPSWSSCGWSSRIFKMLGNVLVKVSHFFGQFAHVSLIDPFQKSLWFYVNTPNV